MPIFQLEQVSVLLLVFLEGLRRLMYELVMVVVLLAIHTVAVKVSTSIFSLIETFHNSFRCCKAN